MTSRVNMRFVLVACVFTLQPSHAHVCTTRRLRQLHGMTLEPPAFRQLRAAVSMMAEPPAKEPAAEVEVDVDAAPKRETAEEAWEKAPDGSFLSPALAGALVLTGMVVRSLLTGSGESASFF